MLELMELVRGYGRLMYDAGVYEMEENHQEHLDKAEDLLEHIEWLLESEAI